MALSWTDIIAGSNNATRRQAFRGNFQRISDCTGVGIDDVEPGKCQNVYTAAYFTPLVERRLEPNIE